MLSKVDNFKTKKNNNQTSKIKTTTKQKTNKVFEKAKNDAIHTSHTHTHNTIKKKKECLLLLSTTQKCKETLINKQPKKQNKTKQKKKTKNKKKRLYNVDKHKETTVDGQSKSLQVSPIK
ncbi:hypothetical protein RFI_26246 [Reticulomyxa filosa]|uniref:Uncharacterized protein n=1 Tax=Reticulomyxa filosa TaxID=46433 RepID=X6MDK7_RETFI|nr:hypothetical protein RFI_26246 [Reticulomyxa filosa]|eukprot:ETO11130.1 hypothetical protein RFI_26246 [Reticulomyxa filosa]